MLTACKEEEEGNFTDAGEVAKATDHVESRGGTLETARA